MVPLAQLKPEPRCQLLGFGDSSLNLELRIWINDPANGRANVISEVLSRSGIASTNTVSRSLSAA